MGGADLHCSQSGVTDHYALCDEHALEIARGIVRNLNPKPPNRFGDSFEPPLYDADDIYGIIDGNGARNFDVREIIARWAAPHKTELCGL